MKLAEALSERKAIKTRMEDLRRRLYQNVLVQEGDAPIEDPLALLKDLQREIENFAAIIARINRINNETRMEDGTMLSDAILKKDMLNYLHLSFRNIADKATPAHERYSAREIKMVPTIDIRAIRKQADEIAKEYRQLDIKIQEVNWKTEMP